MENQKNTIYTLLGEVRDEMTVKQANTEATAVLIFVANQNGVATVIPAGDISSLTLMTAGGGVEAYTKKIAEEFLAKIDAEAPEEYKKALHEVIDKFRSAYEDIQQE